MTRPPIDQIDSALDLLRTAWCALQNDGWLDEQNIRAVSGTIEAAIQRLGPVRQHVNEVHGRGSA